MDQLQVEGESSSKVLFMDQLQVEGESSSKEFAPIEDATAQINPPLADHVDNLFLALAADDDLLTSIIEEEALPVVADAVFADQLQLQEVISATFVDILSPESEEQSSSEKIRGKRPLVDYLEIRTGNQSFGNHDYTLTCTESRAQVISSDDDILMLKSSPSTSTVIFIDATKERGESSSNTTSRINPPDEGFCTICLENKPMSEFSGISKCGHSFCNECIGGYIESKVEENIAVIKCPDPDCGSGILEPQFCRKFVKAEVFDRWGTNLCESTINEASKFYCPFKDCSALLLMEGEENVVEAECPHCHRMFCAKCRVTWHAGIGCEDFQKLPEEEREREDRILLDVAKKSNWQRCPSCNFFVEKIDGCMFIKCRCGYTFCYGCATTMTTDHYCAKCQR